MNKIKALVTMLVLGTSAAAFAAPTATVEYNQPAPVTATVVRGDWQQPMPAPAPQASWHHKTQWTTLAGSAKLAGTREYIRVGAQAGRFDKLELQQVSGKTQIAYVQINFANGGSQLARLNTTLDRNNTVATIALNGQNRSIASITIYGSSNARSAYSILAA